jgi:5'-nucleotidase
MNSRKDFIVKSSLATAALLAAKPFSSLANSATSLLPISDSNSVLLAHTSNSYTANFDKAITAISTLKKENGNAVLLDAVNVTSSTNSKYARNKNLALMQQVGYDAMLPGNIDLEEKNNSSVSMVASNYAINNSGFSKKVEPYKIIYKGNIKIGIIGAGKDMNNVSSTAATTASYKNPVEEVNMLATYLKEEKNCNLVVCLSHLGNNNAIDDSTLAKNSVNVDVIVSSNDEPVQYTRIHHNKNNEEVIINPTGDKTIVGKITIGFDKKGKKNLISLS